MKEQVRITECPRDAMQGIKPFIPTSKKVAYHKALLEAGFDTLDFGSFVSPKAIPQMRDTAEVATQLPPSDTKLLAIVGNRRGAQEAVSHSNIRYLGYPFSISPTFLKRNLNTTIENSFALVKDLLIICQENQKELVTYVSMAFGNPYEDPWNSDMLLRWIDHLQEVGVKHISIADTYGLATPDMIGFVTKTVNQTFKSVHFSLHLHTSEEQWQQKVEAAYDHGCLHFEGVLNGLGGCPMAGPKLIGNLKTTNLLQYFDRRNIAHNINLEALQQAEKLASQIMG